MIYNNVAFRQVQAQTSLRNLLISLETQNDIQSAAKHSYNIQVTHKGSDQTVGKRRLTRGLAGHTNHIVGNLMHWLNYD